MFLLFINQLSGEIHNKWSTTTRFKGFLAIIKQNGVNIYEYNNRKLLQDKPKTSISNRPRHDALATIIRLPPKCPCYFLHFNDEK